MFRLLLILLIALHGVACVAAAPRSACGVDAPTTPGWSDPVTLVDRYDGPSFSELGDLEVGDGVVGSARGWSGSTRISSRRTAR